MGFDSIIARVNDLPPLPESVQKIQQLYAQGEPEMRDIVKLVESDPVLTADILAKVNSPLYSFSKNIVSILQAGTLFGSVPLRGFVISSFIGNSFKVNMEPYGISNEEFKNVSALQSALMFQWYMGVDLQRAKLLVPISFLMEMGKIIIAKEVIESSYGEQFNDAIKESDTITEVERLFTDMSSAEINTLLFEHWNFNEFFVNTMRYLDDPLSAPEEYAAFVEALDVVRTCVNIKEVITEKSFNAAKAKVMKYGLPVDRFIRTVERLQSKINN